MSAAFSHLQVGDNAHVRYFTSQDLTLDSIHFSHQRVELGKDSRLEHDSVMLGALRHKSELKVILGGEGAESKYR